MLKYCVLTFSWITTATDTPTDIQWLKWALNVEYLQAEYFLRSVNGTGLEQIDIAGPIANNTNTNSTNPSNSTVGVVTGGRAVNFSTPLARQMAQEMAADHLAHVRLLRQVLADKVIPRPAIDFTNGFRNLSRLAGIGADFDAFANETSWLLGAYFFGDVAVTAWAGAADAFNNSEYALASALIMGADAYEAGEIRTRLLLLPTTPINNNTTSPGSSNSTIVFDPIDTANKISAWRNQVGGANKDQGLTLNGVANVVPADEQGEVFVRDFTEVLKIFYLTSNNSTATTTIPAAGGFFPNGISV